MAKYSELHLDAHDRVLAIDFSEPISFPSGVRCPAGAFVCMFAGPINTPAGKRYCCAQCGADTDGSKCCLVGIPKGFVHAIIVCSQECSETAALSLAGYLMDSDMDAIAVAVTVSEYRASRPERPTD